MSEFTAEETLLFIQTPHMFFHTLKRHMTIPKNIHLNTTQTRTLLNLRNFGPVSMHCLGDMVGIMKGSLTQVIDGLVNAGLVERNRNPDDRRSVLVSITPKGLNVTKRLDDNLIQHIHGVLDPLDEQQKQKILTALQTLQESLDWIEQRNIHATK